MEEKYGFVYIWRDRKYGRYYIGCHWGTEDDGYICSSKWMKISYQRRSDDFRKRDGSPNRRILARIYTNRKDLLEEEYRWLQFIKKEELKVRYYNLHKHHFGHWTLDENKSKDINKRAREKQKQYWEQHPEEYQEYRKRNYEACTTLESRAKNSEKLIEYWNNLERRKTWSEQRKEYYKTHDSPNKGVKQSAEQIETNRQCLLDLWNTPEYREKQMLSRNNSEKYKNRSESIKKALKKKKD